MNTHVLFSRRSFPRLSVLLVLSLSSTARAVSSYQVTDLGSINGVPVDQPSSINNAGLIGGEFVPAQFNGHAFLAGAIPGSPVDYTVTAGINNPSLITKVSNNGRLAGLFDNGASHAFWSEPNHGAWHDLGANHWADGITDSAQITGYRINFPGYQAFITDANAANERLLGSLNGPSGESFGLDINSTAQVAGYSDAGTTTHAFLTGANGAGMADLGSLAGAGGASHAYGLNDLARVVGDTSVTGQGTHAFLTGPGGVGMVDLGSLGGAAKTSVAWDVNAAGVVVGKSQTAGTTDHAFVYDGTLKDLNSLLSNPTGWQLTTANAINDQGKIVGTGLFNGQSHGFLLTPVPEPATAGIYGSGGAMLMLTRCRRMPRLIRERITGRPL